MTNTKDNDTVLSEHSPESGKTIDDKASNAVTNNRPKRYSKLSEDERVCKSFIELVQEKFDNGLLSVPKGSPERKLLDNVVIYPGFYAGAFVGMAQFIIMRRAPIYLMNRHLAKQKQKQAQQAVPFREGSWSRPWTLALDASFSIATGLFVWMLALDKKKMFQTTADIPLMEGQSNVSDALCSDFIQHYHTIRPEFWVEYKDDSLTSLQDFVKNCQKRQAYEKKIRKEQMMIGEETNNNNESISLPNKVPLDILQTVEEEEKQLFDWANIEDFEEEDNNSNTDSNYWTISEPK